MTEANAAPTDRAGLDFWDDVWVEAGERNLLDLDAAGAEGYVVRRFATLFRDLLGPGEGRSLIEVGCAGSAWLPFFGSELGFAVAGLDYSPRGCEEARSVLRRADVDGDVFCADLFSPPPELVGAFDAAVSQGVVEHFDDTAGSLEAVAGLVRPGGKVLTLIPNLTGVIGAVTRTVNRPVWETHVLLTRAALVRAHERAGLDVVQSSYFLSTGFGITNLHGLEHSGAGYVTKAVALRALKAVSKAVYILESRTAPLPARRRFAPYAYCLAQKP